MKTNEFSLLVGGEAGAGINRSGFLFAKACLRGGLYVFGRIDYQSLIRGGHNFYTVRVGSEEFYSQEDTVDIIVALNRETIILHKNELVSGGGIIYDGQQIQLTKQDLGRNDVKLFSIPLQKIVKELKGPEIIANTVALGVTVAILDYDLELLNSVLLDTFKEKTTDLNIDAAKRGYNYAKNNFKNDLEFKLKKTRSFGKKRHLLTGNEAIAIGALNAGCRFYTAYPMTPSTSILHFLAPLVKKYKIHVLQAESEIAAINMVAGASFAGLRSMTATSGGGFCLMSEGIGMIGMTELSPVIVLVQRPGPSTGLPTYTAQGDLRFAIHASHGEFPRVVIAPGDVEECFYLTMEAFNLAEKFQIPAIIISDKYLAESHQSSESFDEKKIGIDRGTIISEEYNGEEEYQRHKITENGISPKAIPGTKGAIVRSNADEHNQFGYTTEDPIVTTKMMEKRNKKLKLLSKELQNYETVKLYGSEKINTLIIGWGSTKGPIREAMKILKKEGIELSFLQIIYPHPFPVSKVKKIIDSVTKNIVIENNLNSQLSSLIEEYLLTKVDHKILKYDGRPFNPVSLSKQIKEVL